MTIGYMAPVFCFDCMGEWGGGGATREPAIADNRFISGGIAGLIPLISASILVAEKHYRVDGLWGCCWREV